MAFHRAVEFAAYRCAIAPGTVAENLLSRLAFSCLPFHGALQFFNYCGKIATLTMGKNFFSACNHSQATQALFLTRPTAKDSMYGGAAVLSIG